MMGLVAAGFVLGGSASVQGTVTYNDQPGYSPKVNAKRDIVMS